MRLARALRPRESFTLRDAVALDERLRRAAGPYLVVSRTRPHRARERVREQLRAEAQGGPVVAERDTMACLIIAGLALGAHDGGPPSPA